MTTTLGLERLREPAATGRDDQPMTRREELAFLVFATWTIGGLFLDGWAHQQGKPESFFTPWHGVLYSGFAAAMLFAGIDAIRQGRSPVTAVAPGSAAGSRLTATGIGLFVAGGVGDGIWHEVFGIEEDIEALLSPTHLLLMTGGLLLATGPLRAAWATATDRAPGLWQFLPKLFGATLSAALISFFLMFLSPFENHRPDVRFDGDEAYGIAGILIFNLVWIAPLFALARRWKLPFGSVTVHIGVLAVAMAGLDGFSRLPLVAGFFVAGIVGDLVLARLQGGLEDGALSPTAARQFGAALPLALWLPYFGVWFGVYDLGWTPELWTGTIFLNVLGGVALSLLALPPGAPAALARTSGVDHARAHVPEHREPARAGARD